MDQPWKNALESALIKAYGKKEGSLLIKKYDNAIPISYRDEYTIEMVVLDIPYLEQLSPENPLLLYLYETEHYEHHLHLRLFQWQEALALYEISPILENLDLRLYNERSYKLSFENNKNAFISDFAVIYPKAELNIKEIHDLFQDAFTNIYFGRTENDGFNKLVLGGMLWVKEVRILRTYAKYLHQVGFRFSQAYIEKAITNQIEIAKNLIALFLTRFDPQKQHHAKTKTEEIEKNILQALEKVSSLDEDRIIRRMLDLIKATVRTNYFQKIPDLKLNPFLSIKLHSRIIPELPLPMPLYEIFMYSPRFEAIHLRNAEVARGGIRWSDRREDFRTEILGLMKAQVVKNAIIVPSGAKGGFVLKKISSDASREALHAEVIACYKLFISGLLDLTDNVKNKKYIPPRDVVCYDEYDPYLVVAADKGTASFSDIANSISKEHDFWLGDAFASGGSTGYDHKKMGITARGAWESIKRHFREFDVDVTKTDISVVGIGDMSGDVFGNGMIYSNHIKLVGAFDHRHIFIDPDPLPQKSYEERLRLFHLPISSWEDYNKKLISKGGGVFKRSVKSITITPEMKRVLQIEDNALAPNDLIRAILKAPVDLLYNGGIGTYVKASNESNADVFDRTNDYCRINGNELRAKVVGEGGNLGFTQLGRIEYALQGGMINTDFIDNSAGVDCSDHEVNLKILLDVEVNKKRLTEEKRNTIIANVTKEVAALVLNDNYEQALVMSFSAHHAKKNIGLHIEYIKELEAHGILKRRVEFMPDDKTLAERKSMGLGLARPELAVLLAYTKIHVKNELLNSKLLSDPTLKQVIETAFPTSLREKYKNAMDDHMLHKNIIATQLSNKVINEMGITFLYRIQTETGVTVDEVMRAYTLASSIFDTHKLQKIIESLDFKISMAEQYSMLYNIRNLIGLATRWFLHSKYLKKDLQSVIDYFAKRVKILEPIIPTLMGGYTRNYLESLTEQFVKAGLDKNTARHIATYRAIYTTLNIIEVTTKHDLDLIKTAKVYFAAGEKVNLLWFRDQIANDSREGHWNVLARLTLRDELDTAQRAVTVAIMKNDKKDLDAHTLIEKWMKQNSRALDRWERLLSLMHSSNNYDYTMFFIAMRELIGLIFITAQMP